jgi:hypothetical protein
MALATSPAAAISWPSRCVRTTLTASLLLSLAAPALAADQVYIWRDQNGAVQFSAVREAPNRPIASIGAESVSTIECSAQSAIDSSDTNRLAAY